MFHFSYNATYRKQIDMDVKLRKYVGNMRKAFNGRNTVADQLSFRSVPNDSAHPHYAEGEGEDEVSIGVIFICRIVTLMYSSREYLLPRVSFALTPASGASDGA